MADLPVDIPRMASLAADMVRKSLQSFIEADADMARTVLTMDDAVDAMNRAAYKALTKVMEEESHLAPQALNALMISPHPGAGRRPRHQHCRGRDLLGAGRRCAAPQEPEDGSRPARDGVKAVLKCRVDPSELVVLLLHLKPVILRNAASRCTRGFGI